MVSMVISLPFSFQHLIYSSNHLNYTLVWALLDTLSRELQALVGHPNGTKTNPGTTCKELLLAHPGLPDGIRGMGGTPRPGPEPVEGQAAL